MTPEQLAQFAKLLPEGALSREELKPIVEAAVAAWLTRLDFDKLVAEAATAKINKLIAQP